MEAYDVLLPAFLKKWDIPAASVAVMKDDHLVFAHAYGWADVENRIPAEPQARFRIASISKLITATAVLHLVQERRLRLDDKLFELLPEYLPAPEAKPDSRFANITVRHLLQHTAGWRRGSVAEWTDTAVPAAKAAGISAPASIDDCIHYVLRQPLQFDPGSEYSYCNFGFILLSRVIEKVSGEPYETYVRQHIFKPAGVRFIRQGRTRPTERAPLEVNYYDFRGRGPTDSVFNPGTKVAAPDGSFCQENLFGCSGWIASAPELLRFFSAIDGNPGRPDVLNAETEALRDAPPSIAAAAGSRPYYGMGAFYNPSHNPPLMWHSGALPGSITMVQRAKNGVSWVILLNSRPQDEGFGEEVTRVMWKAYYSVQNWPAMDMFDNFRPEYTE